MEFEEVFGPTLRVFRESFLIRVNAHFARAYLIGQAQMMQYGSTKLGRPVYFEGPAMREAIRYAQLRGAELIKTLEPNLHDQVNKIVADAIREKRGLEALRRDLQAHFGELEKYQAERIARTETANALMEGSIDRGKQMGVTGKEWITTPFGEYPCEECEGNEAAGVIPMNEAFPSGVMHPPAHPSCACALGYAMLPEKGE